MQKCVKILRLDIIKKKRKDSKKNLAKNIKIFPKKKRKQYEHGRNKNLSENKKIKAC